MSKDLYAVLGLKKDDNPSQQDIKKAYRKASLKYHPDRQGGKTDEEKKAAEEKFKEVTEAYSVLSDADKKSRYDTFGTYGDGSDMGGGNPFEGFNFNFGGGGGSPFDDLRDLFGGGFGGFGGGRSSRPQAKPGGNKQMRIPLTIEDIYNGVTKTVKYTRDVRCQNCHGSGGKTKTCPHCNGSGVVVNTQRTAFGITQTQSVCPHCGGRGVIVEEKCPTCGGSGFRKEECEIKVTFRKGVQDGEYVVIQGGGNESRDKNASNGSFIAIAQWNFDTERYEINGADVIEHVKVPYATAILGDKIKVTLPDGKMYSVMISPCTEPGKRYVLRGKGMSITDNYGRFIQGNYVVVIDYIIPKVLDDEEREMLKKIQEIHSAEAPTE